MTRRSIPAWVHTALLAAVLAVIAWGALAFGAVYPWAFQPLAAACALVGAAAFAAGRAERPPLIVPMPLLAIVAGAIALQLLPLGADTLRSLSPATDGYLGHYNLTYVVTRQHPLSIAPDNTLVGLMLFSALAVWLLGTARLFSATGANAIARLIVCFGILLAMVGVAQDGLTAHEVHPLIYGFWKPQFESRPFGPFVNPNHFAGWMLMTLPIALGMFYDRLLRLFERTSARDRMDMVNAPEFGGVLLYGFASVVMGLSLLMTRSRSALGAFLVASILALLLVLRRLETRRSKAIVSLAFAVIIGGTAIWAGADALIRKFAESNDGVLTVGGRIGAWRDTLDIIRDFPLTGVGLDAYGTAMRAYEHNQALHFNEAHNDYLQLAAEGGLLIGVPALLLAISLIRAMRARFAEAPKEGTTYWVRSGAVIGLIAIALQSLVEFSLQMPGNAALFAIVVALAIHRSPSVRTSATKTSAPEGATAPARAISGGRIAERGAGTTRLPSPGDRTTTR